MYMGDLKSSKKILQQAVAKIVKKHRLAQNKSLSRISAEIIMTKSMWNDLEKGIKDPQLSTIWRISEALDIPVDELVREIKTELGAGFSLTD